MGSSGATLGVGGNWGPITRLSLWDLCHTNLLMATCFATKSCKCVNLSSLSARLGWNQFSSKDVRRCRSLSGLGSIWWLGPCLGRQRGVFKPICMPVPVSGRGGNGCLKEQSRNDKTNEPFFSLDYITLCIDQNTRQSTIFDFKDVVQCSSFSLAD